MTNQITILTEIDGELHLVAMDADELETIEVLIKTATKYVIPTGKMQRQLNNFLGWSE